MYALSKATFVYSLLSVGVRISENGLVKRKIKTLDNRMLFCRLNSLHVFASRVLVLAPNAAGHALESVVVCFV